MDMPYHSMDKGKASDFAMLSEDDVSGRYILTNIPPPPPRWMENITCYTPNALLSDSNGGQENNDAIQNELVNRNVTPEDVLKFFLLCISSILTVFFNILFIFVLITQNQFKKRWIRNQPRFIFISIGINDLIMGILVLVLSTYPALYKCWPFGRSLCQVQVNV